MVGGCDNAGRCGGGTILRGTGRAAARAAAGRRRHVAVAGENATCTVPVLTVTSTQDFILHAV